MFKRAPLYGLVALLSLALSVAIIRAPIAGGAPIPVHLSPEASADAMASRSEYALVRSWEAARREDGETASAWAKRSLHASPGNAYAALALAWGEALRGDEAAARDALEESYELAQRSTPLAPSRVALAVRWWPELSDDARARLLEEARVARGLDAHAFNTLASADPRLGAVYDLSEDGGFRAIVTPRGESDAGGATDPADH